MRRTPLVLALALFLIGVSLLSGCGESGSTADVAAPIPKAEFVKKANAICTQANQELGKIAEKFSQEKNLSEKNRPTDAQVTELAELSLPPIKRQVEELRALGVPTGDEEQVDEFLSAAEEAVEKGERDPAALYGANGGAFAKANRLATDYGLDKCGE